MRPFTLGQLKELLSRTGTLVEEGFWIDKIKSHCYVTVSFYKHVFSLIKSYSSEPDSFWPVENFMSHPALSVFSTVAQMRRSLHGQLFME